MNCVILDSLLQQMIFMSVLVGCAVCIPLVFLLLGLNIFSPKKQANKKEETK